MGLLHVHFPAISASGQVQHLIDPNLAWCPSRVRGECLSWWSVCWTLRQRTPWLKALKVLLLGFNTVKTCKEKLQMFQIGLDLWTGLGLPEVLFCRSSMRSRAWSGSTSNGFCCASTCKLGNVWEMCRLRSWVLKSWYFQMNWILPTWLIHTYPLLLQATGCLWVEWLHLLSAWLVVDVVIYINSGLAALAVMKLTRNCMFFLSVYQNSLDRSL